LKKPKPEPDDAMAARLAAMDLLALREHSRRELARKLATRGFDPATIEIALDGLAGENLQSDARFAEQFVHARVQRGSGPQKIRAELRERGLSDTRIADAMATMEDAWLEQLRAVREKKFGPELPVDYRERARQMRFLQQRGFSGEQIGRLFRDIDEA
jgi:regulatory protein